MADEKKDFSCSRIGGAQCPVLENYDPETCCEFDKQHLCHQKEERLREWRRAIEYYAEHKINNVIYTSATMFTECPNTSCFRRQLTRKQR